LQCEISQIFQPASELVAFSPQGSQNRQGHMPATRVERRFNIVRFGVELLRGHDPCWQIGHPGMLRYHIDIVDDSCNLPISGLRRL
jgi:hypothetical protein